MCSDLWIVNRPVLTRMRSLYSKPLTAWTIPGIASFGPEIAAQFVANMQMKAIGEIIAGTGVSIPSGQAVLDLVNKKNSGASGWTPQYKPFASAAVRLLLLPRPFVH
jgi:hypothetical protein